MAKQKHQPKNFFQYFLDEYILFRRDFRFEVETNPERLVEAINNLYDDTGTWWWRKRRIIPSFNHFQGQVHFELVAEQPNKSGYSQSAKAEGIIHSDESTILEGQITIGSWGYFFFILLIGGFVFLCLMSSQLPLSVLVVYGLFAFGFWMRSYFDRNHLFNLIQQAVESIHLEGDEQSVSETRGEDIPKQKVKHG